MTAAELASVLHHPNRIRVGALDENAIDAACDHGVGPLLYVTVREAGLLEEVSPAIRDRLARLAREAVLVDSCRRHHAASTLAALAGRGIVPLVFKGAALAHTLYGEPWLRPHVDVDVLVRDEDMEAAADTLDRVGCTRMPRPTGEHVTHQFTYAASVGGVVAAYDVHRRIADPHVFADVLRFDELERESIPVPQLAPSARTPCAVHALLIACVHRIAHHFDADMLIQIVDIDRLARRLSADGWIALTALAQTRGMCAVCARGLTLARDWLGTPVPDAAMRALGIHGHEKSAAYLQRGLRKVDVFASDLRSMRTWRARLGLVREHLFPPAEYLLTASGSRNRATLPFLYARRIVRGARAWFDPLRD